MIGYPNESVVSYKHTAKYRMRMIALGAVITFGGVIAQVGVLLMIRLPGRSIGMHEIIFPFAFCNVMYMIYIFVILQPKVKVWERGIGIGNSQYEWDAIESASVEGSELIFKIRPRHSYKHKAISIRLDIIERSGELLEQIRKRVAVS